MRRAVSVWLLVLVIALLSAAEGPVLPPPVKRTVDFRQDVFPLLESRCFRCHKGVNPSSNKRLDFKAELLGETDGRPVVLTGKSAQSRLIHYVSGVEPDHIMPPRGERLSSEQVGVLRAWIDQGLPWDEKLLPSETPTPDHWAFRSVKPVAPPHVQSTHWVRNVIDAFIAARHEAESISPSPQAAPRVLIRRLSLDLIGLPPTPAEVEAFVAASVAKPQAAYEELVERLLASPHYGERWGRHWLDLARWAESEGFESNHPRPFAWRYRDYVVNSFNADKPYDRFLREQLAGDEQTPYSDDNLIATGFLAAARQSSNEEDKALQRNDVLVDIVNATAASILGLTLNCAQCHNHKFDPFTARDYYRFQGFFAKGYPGNLELRDPELWKVYEAARPPEYEPARKKIRDTFETARAGLIADAKKALSAEMLQALDVPGNQRSSEQQRLAREADLKFQFAIGRIENAIPKAERPMYDQLKKLVEEFEKRIGERPQTFGFFSPATSPRNVEVLPSRGFYPLPYEPAALTNAKSHLLAGGDVHRQSAALEPGWPAIFGPTPSGAVDKTPRTALADWLTDPKHPLTARVWVNRLWQGHFGRGLVATASDFGTRGDLPSHPKLLDWLALELIRSGWSTKHIHRLIVTSAAYRQASGGRESLEADPDNALLTRWHVRRLEAEVIRDSMLAASGDLDTSVGGASVQGDESVVRRRSLYLFQKRENPPQSLGLFDGPNQVTESCSRRYVSTVPLQSLYLLNNDFAVRRGRTLAWRVFHKGEEDRDQQIDATFRFVLSRQPTVKERELSRRFFTNYPRQAVELGGPSRALVHFCQAMLNVNEFVYLD